MWFYLPTVSPLWHPLIPLCNIPVFLFPMFICLLFQVSPALPNVCHTPVFLLLPLPYFVSVIQFASLPHLLYNIMASHPVHHHPVFSFFPSPIVHLLLFYFPTLPLVLLPPLYTTTPSSFFSPSPILCLWFYLPPTTTCMTPFPLQQRPVFALILFPNFVSFIIVTDVSVW